MKKLVLATLIVGLFITSGYATTASYNMVVRLVNASNLVVNFTASAVAANYNMTAQVVSSTGTVLNPGTPSATSATPNMTIRIVDANGFVQDSLGGGAASITTVASISALTGSNSISISASKQVNDLAVFVASSNTTTETCPINWTQTAAPVLYSSGTDAVVCYHCVQSGDPTSVTMQTAGTVVTACGEIYRGVTGCNLDAQAVETTTTGNATASIPAITTNTNNSWVISGAVTTNPTTGTYTNLSAPDVTRVNAGSGSGTQYGCYFADRPVASAGAVGARSLTISGAADTAGFSVAIQP